jgi:antitoxin YefM
VLPAGEAGLQRWEPRAPTLRGGAGVAELEYAAGLGPAGRKPLEVRVLSPALALLLRVLYTNIVARVIPFTEARARLTELLDDVEARHEHLVITRKGRPVAVVVSPAEWEAVEETLAVLQDEQALADLRESEEDVKAGRLFSLDEVRRDLGLA